MYKTAAGTEGHRHHLDPWLESRSILEIALCYSLFKNDGTWFQHHVSIPPSQAFMAVTKFDKFCQACSVATHVVHDA